MSSKCSCCASPAATDRTKCERHLAQRRVQLKLLPKHAPRFWSCVDRNGPIQTHTPQLGPCWTWQAGFSGGGVGENKYGIFRRHKAHRAAWFFTHGAIPDGLVVMHRCDYPPCVNPSHLQLGTTAENNLDATRKGRAKTNNLPRRTGEASSGCRFSDATVAAVRASAARGDLQKDIAARYGMTRQNVSLIVLGRSRAQGSVVVLNAE